MTIDYRTIGKLTQKGDALHKLASNHSSRDAEVLTLGTGNLTTETVTVNGVVYELLSVATDTGANTANSDFNNTDAGPLAVELTSHNVLVGAILRVESEFFVVDQVVDANNLILSRGQFGSAIAAHSDPKDVFETATAPAAGTKTVPASAIATAATLAGELATALNYHDDNTIVAVAVGADVVIHVGDEQWVVTVDVTDLTDATAATITGVRKGAINAGFTPHTITAGEATAGTVRFILDFAPSFAVAFVSDAGVLLTEAGITATVNGNVVDVAEGATPWAAGDGIVLLAG